MKDETMLPNPAQDTVQKQAIDRLAKKMQMLDEEDSLNHSNMISNLMASDHQKHLERQHQRKANSQIQKYLRLQIDQKKNSQMHERDEKNKYKPSWDRMAPQEDEHHQRKVIDVIGNRVREQKNYHLQMLDAQQKVFSMQKMNDRETQRKNDSLAFEKYESEKRIIEERKRQMQQINKQVWLDQIALNKVHKRLNL